MKGSKIDPYPVCPYPELADDCFASTSYTKEHTCKILTDAAFLNRELCPFYKSAKQHQNEMIASGMKTAKKPTEY